MTKQLIPRRNRCLAAAIVFVRMSISSVVLAQGGLVDIPFDIRDQAQDMVRKSQQGVIDAMQEGPPPDPRDRPWSLEDLQKIQQKNATLANLNKTLAQAQQKLLTADTQILSKLPPNDPRRAELTAEVKNINAGMADSHAKAEEFGQKLAEANGAIDSWKMKHDPNYVPSSPPSPPPDTKVPTPPQTDTALEALKGKEATLEAQEESLSKEREAAVVKYVNDPTPENRASAEQLKQQLVGLVDSLNQTRQQVDTITGKSRPGIKIRSAQQIADECKDKGKNGTASENHHQSANSYKIVSTQGHRRTGSSLSSQHHTSKGVAYHGQQSLAQTSNGVSHHHQQSLAQTTYPPPHQRQYKRHSH